MPGPALAVFVSSRLELLQAAALAARTERAGAGIVVITPESAPELAAEARLCAGRGWARALREDRILGGNAAIPASIEALLFEQAPSQLVLPGALENPAGPVSICAAAARRISVPTVSLWPEDSAALLSEGLREALTDNSGGGDGWEDYILAEFSPYGVWGWPNARVKLAEVLDAIAEHHDISVDWNWRRALPAGVAAWTRLAARARLILTDRTDVQIAACLLGRPCISLRERTPVPETVRAGAALLAGARPEEVNLSVGLMLRKTYEWHSPWPSAAMIWN